ncbi:MAG: DUF2157 domain-containing protein [Chlamydiota bacterium]
MKIVKSDLDSAVQKELLSSDQAKNLWDHLESIRTHTGKFKTLHVLYYFAGLLISTAMSLFLIKAWENGGALMALSGFFALIHAFIGDKLWKKNMKIPGGILITAAVGLTPLFIYGFQKTVGLWPLDSFDNHYFLITGNQIFMELGTILAALTALRFYRFSFIIFPLALSLWLMSMDLIPLLLGANSFNSTERHLASSIFGLIVLISSYFVDKKFQTVDFAFWTYLYGMLTFWSGLSSMDTNTELGRFVFCLLNISFIFIAVYLRRKVFAVFGTFGVLIYLGHLAWHLFTDSYAFPLILTFLGLAILLICVKYQSRKNKIKAVIEKWIPSFLMKWRPKDRVS